MYPLSGLGGGKRMDKLFNSVWALRVTALILAFLLFFYVKSELDTGQLSNTTSDMDIITDVPLEVYYDTENLIVSGLPKTVNVTIEGPMQLVLQAKLKKDYKVFVDLNSLLIGEHRVTIQHENFSEKLEVLIDPKYVDVVIEEKVTKEYRVDPEINNSIIADGYELANMAAEPRTVYVTGAKSAIDSINYVKATIKAENGITESFQQEAAVKVLDSNLNKLDVLIEPEIVKVAVNVREYSREIPVVMIETGTPKEGITIDSVESQLKTIEVFGPKSIIDQLTQLEVEFDVSEIEDTGLYNVNFEIPTGVTRLSSKTSKVQVNVTKDPSQEETLEQDQLNRDEQSTNGENENNSLEETPDSEDTTD